MSQKSAPERKCPIKKVSQKIAPEKNCPKKVSQKPCYLSARSDIPRTFDGAQMSPIAAHIERPKGIAGNFSAVKNAKQSTIEKYNPQLKNKK